MSYDFERGDSDYVTRATPLMTTMGNFTISVWFKLESTGTDQCLVCNGVDGGYGQGFALVVDSTASLKGLFPFVAWIGGSSTLSTGTWYHAALVRSSGTTQAYLNGSTAGSSSGSTPYNCDTNADTVIGARRTTAPSFDWYFDGLIAEAAMWNTALTSGNISDLAAETTTPDDYSSGLLFYKKFTDSGEARTDEVDTYTNWTIGNTPVYSSDHPIDYGGGTVVKDLLGTGFIPFAR